MRPLAETARRHAVTAGVVLAAVALALIGALIVHVVSSSSDDGLNDQRFLNLTSYNDTLRLGIAADQISLGHEMCSMLGKYHGNVQQAEAAVASGYESTFTPSVLEALRQDATATYCPKYA